MFLTTPWPGVRAGELARPGPGTTFTVTHSGTSSPSLLALRQATMRSPAHSSNRHAPRDPAGPVPALRPGELTECVTKAVGPQRAREVKLGTRSSTRDTRPTVIVVAHNATEPARCPRGRDPLFRHRRRHPGPGARAGTPPALAGVSPGTQDPHVGMRAEDRLQA